MNENTDKKLLTVESDKEKKTLIKVCHRCGQDQESQCEIERCMKCQKSFLPLKYFQKIHDIHQNYTELFSQVEELDEKDLIKGLIVIW